jgi:isopentenyl-diphosphate delta-isomerase
MNDITNRKAEHIRLCLENDVAFKRKTGGFEKYDFLHCAVTETDLNEIDLSTRFLDKKINYPFIISCMTGGHNEAEKINASLAEIAAELNIPIGVGSQRQLLESDKFINSYKIVRDKAPLVPVLGNIGAAQLAKMKSLSAIMRIKDSVSADAIVVHLNPLQELMQTEGDLCFKGLMAAIEKLVKSEIKVIVKEVGSGIGYQEAKRLLDCGVAAVDVAGAGGTSWAGVELQRSGKKQDDQDFYFWDWGLPTSYCIKQVKRLKENYKFDLIGSGGINSADDAAKALALGADIVASARIIFSSVVNEGTEKTINMIHNWFCFIKKVMFLTGSQTLCEFRKNKIVKIEELY